MTYDEIAGLSEQLSYRDKFRLAQLLIQLGRREEEEQHPEKRTVSGAETVEYVAERLLSLRPKKKATMLNSIEAMFQFQGGISDADKEHIIDELQKQRRIIVDEKGHVSYPETS